MIQIPVSSPYGLDLNSYGPNDPINPFSLGPVPRPYPTGLPIPMPYPPSQMGPGFVDINGMRFLLRMTPGNIDDALVRREGLVFMNGSDSNPTILFKYDRDTNTYSILHNPRMPFETPVQARERLFKEATGMTLDTSKIIGTPEERIRKHSRIIGGVQASRIHFVRSSQQLSSGNGILMISYDQVKKLVAGETITLPSHLGNGPLQLAENNISLFKDITLPGVSGTGAVTASDTEIEAALRVLYNLGETVTKHVGEVKKGGPITAILKSPLNSTDSKVVAAYQLLEPVLKETVKLTSGLDALVKSASAPAVGP